MVVQDALIAAGLELVANADGPQFQLATATLISIPFGERVAAWRAAGKPSRKSNCQSSA